MKLRGSCHCGGVEFEVRSRTPYPYQKCYCSICRKVAGGGGCAINIMASREGATIEGRRFLRSYQIPAHRTAGDKDEGMSPSRRYFCSRCGSALWNEHPSLPERLYPFASAIDSALPEPPAWTHIMLGSKASWVEVPEGEGHRHFEAYPDESIEEWHRRHGLLE